MGFGTVVAAGPADGADRLSCYFKTNGLYLLMEVGKYDNEHETGTSGSPDVDSCGGSRVDAGFLDTSDNRARYLGIVRNLYVADREKRPEENEIFLSLDALKPRQPLIYRSPSVFLPGVLPPCRRTKK